MAWGQALPIALADMGEKRTLGAGYWQVFPDARPPRYPPDDVKFRLHWIELKHGAKV